MRSIVLAVAALAFIGTVDAASAGCLTGAAVGAVAGHMAGHGKMGAAAGCAVGHHNAKKKKG